MEKLYTVDWERLFIPHDSLLEMVIRGSIMFLVLFALLRVFRRQAGALGVADLLVIVVVADAASNGFHGEGFSLTESAVVVATIFAWDWALDWLGYKSELFSRVIDPEPLKVINDGRILRKNLESEMITEDELWGQLRLQGIDDLALVKEAYFESGGEFSVLRTDEKHQGNKTDDKAVN